MSLYCSSHHGMGCTVLIHISERQNFSMILYFTALYWTVCTAAPIVGWGRYEHFEYGCCIAFSDPSLNSRSYVVTALIAVFFLPICRITLYLKMVLNLAGYLATTLEGCDKWIMSKFWWTTILRSFFDIFERLLDTQNFFVVEKLPPALQKPCLKIQRVPPLDVEKKSLRIKAMWWHLVSWF